MDWLPDAIDATTEFVSSNVGPTMTLLGALLALLTARFVHYDRVRREHNERIRKLLGEYVAAIAARDDAAEILDGRRAERRAISGPLDVVRQLKMDAPTPAVQAADARVLDAREELRRAESRVSSLFSRSASRRASSRAISSLPRRPSRQPTASRSLLGRTTSPSNWRSTSSVIRAESGARPGSSTRS